MPHLFHNKPPVAPKLQPELSPMQLQRAANIEALSRFILSPVDHGVDLLKATRSGLRSLPSDMRAEHVQATAQESQI